MFQQNTPMMMKDPSRVGLEELYALARTNPVAHACLQYAHREVCTLDQALIACILILAEQNKELTDKLLHNAYLRR